MITLLIIFLAGLSSFLLVLTVAIMFAWWEQKGLEKLSADIYRRSDYK